MTTPVYQIDAFNDTAFKGNPAAVCLLQETKSEQWMQSVASEMNLSETAFISSRNEINEFDLRWFTPTIEVDLCGHATLASAHILFESKVIKRNLPIVFHTRSGELITRCNNGLIEMDFPAQTASPVGEPPELTTALALSPVYIGKNQDDLLVILDTETQVRECQPNFKLLSTLPVRGIIVSARADDERYDFVSRFFAPAAGIDEDPVTGSAHCCLAPYWQQQTGKSQMLGLQVSKRSGEVSVRIKENRIFLAGQAITILKGELYV